MAREIGKTGLKRYNGTLYEEFVPELIGTRGIEVYKEMSKNDDVVGAVLFAVNMLIRQCDFNVEPGGKKQKDKKAAEFIEECLGDMEYSWTATLSEILSFLPYGWSYHEIVYKVRNGKKKNAGFSSKYSDGLIGWKKLPIRAQDTLYEWSFDENTDELIGMVQQPPPNFEQLFIPIEKALHFTTQSIKSNPEGESVLRNAYRSWYFKKRIQEIEGIGIERDLAGFPVLKAPEGYENLWDPRDSQMQQYLAAATTIVSSIRRDEREGLVLPPGWEMELLSTGGTRQFDTNQIIERYNNSIANTILANFIFLGQQSVGSFALSSDKTRLFSLGIGTYMDIICEVFNNQAIPRLIDINGNHFNGITDYPRLVHGDIEKEDIEKLATFLEKVCGIGLLVPDEELEDHVRRVAGLPERKEGQHREYTNPAEAAQNGANAEGTEGMENQQKPEQSSIYKITNILEKYRTAKLERDVAQRLLETIGCDPEDIEFYLKSSDEGRKLTEQQIQAAENDKAGTGSGGAKSKKPASDGSKVKPAKNKKVTDEEDSKIADEAKKSLGRKK